MKNLAIITHLDLVVVDAIWNDVIRVQVICVRGRAILGIRVVAPIIEPRVEQLALISAIATRAAFALEKVFVAVALVANHFAIVEKCFIDVHQDCWSPMTASDRVGQAFEDTIEQHSGDAVNILTARLVEAAVRKETIMPERCLDTKPVDRHLASVSVDGDHQSGIGWIQSKLWTNIGERWSRGIEAQDHLHLRTGKIGAHKAGNVCTKAMPDHREIIRRLSIDRHQASHKVGHHSADNLSVGHRIEVVARLRSVSPIDRDHVVQITVVVDDVVFDVLCAQVCPN